LAVSSVKRSPALPDVPTVDESGLPGFEVSSWYGYFAPAATPKQVIAKVNADMQVILASPEMRTKLAPLGAEPAPTTPESFSKYVRAEIDKWAKVVKDSGAKAD
jgi:tripartite-type tricarboxylate transporter receptor subunit TctC